MKQAKFDIKNVTFEWIENTKKLKKLKQAYDALEEDGTKVFLMQKLGEKIVNLDPSFESRISSKVA